MIVIPAVDLMHGNAVRLEQGAADRVTVYDDDPVALAKRFAGAGAKRLHVVDLQGAFEGRPAQTELLATICSAVHDAGAEVEAGGGIRDADAVARLVEAGADYVVIGTLAVRQPELAEALCREYAGRIVIAADAKHGMVAVEGWTEASSLTARALAEAAQSWGAAAVLHTDVERDGMQVGAAVDATKALQKGLDIPVFASGGVGTLSDLKACAAADLRGVIVGRALYEGAFSIEEALEQC
ncbi:MAG: 1-(5-phosphoribosyl)-5-[(5-phosphoribosylamino)methylideneamino]imidazole-4-carboxamide isomerase [Myxococcota bacterium]